MANKQKIHKQQQKIHKQQKKIHKQQTEDLQAAEESKPTSQGTSEGRVKAASGD